MSSIHLRTGRPGRLCVLVVFHLPPFPTPMTSECRRSISVQVVLVVFHLPPSPTPMTSECRRSISVQLVLVVFHLPPSPTPMTSSRSSGILQIWPNRNSCLNLSLSYDVHHCPFPLHLSSDFIVRDVVLLVDFQYVSITPHLKCQQLLNQKLDVANGCRCFCCLRYFISSIFS